jgi:hypothetical protein
MSSLLLVNHPVAAPLAGNKRAGGRPKEALRETELWDEGRMYAAWDWPDLIVRGEERSLTD